MNKILKLLIVSDVFLYTGFGLIAPILAVFIKEDLVGGSIIAVGIGTTLFMLTKAILQIPFSRYIDKKGNKRFFVMVGYAVVALVPFAYMFMTNVYQLYIIQVLHGFGGAIATPAWLSLFSKNLEKHHESYDWSVQQSSVMIGIAVSALVGAAMAQYLGFKLTFFVVGLFSVASVIILLFLGKKADKKKKGIHYQGIIAKPEKH